MLESTIEKYLVKRVEEIGGVVEKFTSPGRRNVPDRLVQIPGRIEDQWDGALEPGRICFAETIVRPPRVIFVELKAPGKKPTAGQKRDHERRRAMGFRVEVIDSKEGVDGFMETLK